MATTSYPRRRATQTDPADPNSSNAGATAAPSAPGPTQAPAAPLRPDQARGYEANAQHAYDNASAALNAPMPRTELGGGTASATLEDGRTITRTFAPSRSTYDQTVSGGPEDAQFHSGAFPRRTSAPTEAEAQQIASDSQAYAQRQNARGDALLFPVRGVANTSQVREAGQIANDAAAANYPLSVAERNAMINKTNAEATAIAGGVGQHKELQDRLTQTEHVHEADRNAWLREREQLTRQIQQFQTELEKYRTSQQPKPAPGAGAPLNLTPGEAQLIQGVPERRDPTSGKVISPGVPGVMNPEGVQALKRGQYGNPTTQQSGGGGQATQAPVGSGGAGGTPDQHNKQTGEVLRWNGSQWVQIVPPQTRGATTRGAGGSTR